MKKVLKVIGIIFLILVLVIIVLTIKNVINSKKTFITEDDYYKDFKSDAELENKYTKTGSYETSYIEYKSDNKAIQNIKIWYPKELESSNKKYAMIMVVNASNTEAYKYMPVFKRLATWGFIVVGNDDGQTGNAESASETLDFMLNLDNDSVLYNKIDKDNLGIIGYSQGGAGALRAVTQFENGKNYKAIFTGSAAYPLLAKNFGWEYDVSKINIPYFMTASTGTSDDSGKDSNTEYGGVAPLSSLVDIYNNMTDNVFKVRARVTNAEHEDMLLRTDGYMTAWMLYHLQNDADAGKVFIGDDAEILNNSNWQDIEKNN